MGRVFYNWNEALQTKNILHGHAEESGTMAGITITKVFGIIAIYPIFWSASLTIDLVSKKSSKMRTLLTKLFNNYVT